MTWILLAGFLAGRALKYFAEKTAERTASPENALRRAVLSLISRSVMFPVAAFGICVAAKIWGLSERFAALRDDVVSVLVAVIVTYVLYQLVELLDFWIRRFTSKAQMTLNDMMVPLVRKTLRTVIVLLGLVQIAQQLSDKPITSILAGLGVGGLAVALAAQDTIKNFFGSLVIFADHPFQLGDRVAVSGIDGTVEDVGMRSTRIRTLDGHLVTVPNGELANQMIRNVTRRPYIKRVANLTITYDTPPEKVEQAIAIIQEELDQRSEKMYPGNPSRVFFNEFNAASLNILMIYWYAPPDYWEFMAFDQALNLTILRRFNEEGIEFAFPTQTLYLAGDPNRPLGSVPVSEYV